MPSSPSVLTLEQRLALVEKKLHEMEIAQRRLHSDITQNVSEQNAAIVKVVESMISVGLTNIQADVNEIRADMGKLRGSNERQLELLEEAAMERGRRVEREQEIERQQKAKEADMKAKEQEMGLRKQAVAIRGEEAKIVGQDADVTIALMEAKMRRLKVVAAVIISVATTLTGLITAAVASHH